MKNALKSIAIGSFVLLALMNAGCKKCKECTTTTTTTVSTPTPGYPQTTTTTFEACDDDLKSVDGKTTTSTSSIGGITATATARTSCK